MIIDPHVHDRGGRQSYRETPAHVIELCKQQGVDIYFAMPNTDPLVKGKSDFYDRLKEVPEEYRDNYYMWLAITRDLRQVKFAVADYKGTRRIVGLKMYMEYPTEELSIDSPELQLRVIETLVQEDFRGVLCVHCVDKQLLKPDLWDPEDPFTHCLARPAEAEISGIEQMISMAQDAQFEGTLHITHVSCTASVDAIEYGKNYLNISCGVTPGNLMWDHGRLRGPYGLLHKTNPPLRSPDDILGMQDYLGRGKIDWLESDHAPYALGEKFQDPYPSGYPYLFMYSDTVNRFLPSIGLSQQQVRDVTCNNILKVFGDRLRI